MEDPLLEKAKDYFNQQDYEKAFIYAEKSNNKQQNKGAQKIINICQQKLQRPTTSTQNQQQSSQQTSQQTTQQSYEHSYTQEQLQLVNQILKTKNYYEILQIKSDCNLDEIKKAYKKMALKLHPDKNKAPKATEAFRMISKAYDCLSDGNKKANYDRYGEQDPIQQQRQNQNHFQQDDFDPEQIFNMFFGGAQFNNQNIFQNGGFFQYQFHPNQRQRRDQRRDNNDQQTGFGFSHIIILFIILFYFNGYTDQKMYSYSMHKTYQYTIPQMTPNFQINYFIHKDLQNSKDFQYYKKEFSTQIEQQYVQKIYEQCLQEKYNKKWLEDKASQYTGDYQQKYNDMAKKIDLESCKKYEQIRLKI